MANKTILFRFNLLVFMVKDRNPEAISLRMWMIALIAWAIANLLNKDLRRNRNLLPIVRLLNK